MLDQSLEDLAVKAYNLANKLEYDKIKLDADTEDRMWAYLDGIVFCLVENWVTGRMSINAMLRMTPKYMENYFLTDIEMFEKARK